MRNRRNYYRILHVQRDAPPAVIRASYRAILQRLGVHPDLGGENAEAALVNEAYHTLSDPVRRAAYDKAAAPVSETRRKDRPASATPRPASRSRAATGGPTCAFCGAAAVTSDTTRPDAVCRTCGSALCAPGRYQDDSGSRRAMDRLPRHLPMSFRLARSREVAWSGTVEDLSLQGLRFLSPITLQVDERVQIDCAFCSAVAVVKRLSRGTGQERGTLHCAVEFLTLLVKRTRGGLVSAKA